MEKRFIERESRYPTRRKLVKLDSNGNPVGEQLIVSIIRDDEVEGVKRGREGTPICAEALNEMLENAEKALAKSEEAKATAKEANENFVNVVANVKIINNAAGVALANSQAAQYTAEATKSAVKRLEDRVADGGTTVRVNNV
ncbi:MAG: hypothetical protein FWC00_05575, partial [Firmicutes bacterium]|nr:hypothetical protein [Bacillota bacterium]